MITKPKGCYDISGNNAKLYRKIENVVHDYMAVYNYQFVRTPIFESAELLNF